MKSVECDLDCNDFVSVEYDSEHVELSVWEDGKANTVFLTPDKIRKLRKQLKKALLKVEGVKEKTEEGNKQEMPEELFEFKFQRGDKVRIIRDKYKEGDRYAPMSECRSGHGLEINSVVTISVCDLNDKDQPYYVSGNNFGWLSQEDIEPAKEDEA